MWASRSSGKLVTKPMPFVALELVLEANVLLIEDILANTQPEGSRHFFHRLCGPPGNNGAKFSWSRGLTLAK